MTYPSSMIEPEPDHTIFERRDPLIGNAFDARFRIDARLAAGGFGAIYRATELRSGREVALKVLHASLAADPLIAARFRREGATLASLRDPHTVTAYELAEAADGTLYIVMELLRGETLFEAFRKHGGPLPWRRVAAIARAVCSSLAEAHALGIVHRDLKPANIHLQERDGKRDFVKVLDFGIAKVLHGSELDPSELTLAGQTIGTFDYMAPEQMVGGAVGPGCDIYTLGVVMYEMITGRLPFAEATSPAHLLAMLLTTSPPPMAAPTPVPPALDHVVMRCLEREPQDRYASAVELAAALDRVLAGGAAEAAPRTAPAPADAAAAAPPIEPIGAVRAQGSQPAITLAYYGGRASLPPPPSGAAGWGSPQQQQGAAGLSPLPPSGGAGWGPPPPSGGAGWGPPPPSGAAGWGSPPAMAMAAYAPPPQPIAYPQREAAIVGAAAWPQVHHARRRAEGAGFDAARDASMRRIVWTLVLVLGGVLALVVANLR